MTWSEINVQLEKLMERKFHDNLEALIALGKLREIAKREGCRGKLKSFTVKDKRIVCLTKEQKTQVLFPLEEVPKGKSLREKVAEGSCVFEIPIEQNPAVPKEQEKPTKALKEAPATEDTVEKPTKTDEKPKEKPSEGKKSKKAKKSEEPQTPQRKGGRKPRTLKREEKKANKERKARSKSSEKYRKH